MLRMIALKSIVLSLGWRIANPIAIVIKNIRYASRGCYLIPNTIAAVIKDAIGSVVVALIIAVVRRGVVVVRWTVVVVVGAVVVVIGRTFPVSHLGHCKRSKAKHKS